MILRREFAIYQYYRIARGNFFYRERKSRRCAHLLALCFFNIDTKTSPGVLEKFCKYYFLTNQTTRSSKIIPSRSELQQEAKKKTTTCNFKIGYPNFELHRNKTLGLFRFMTSDALYTQNYALQRGRKYLKTKYN